MKNLQIVIVAILFIFLASCKGQNRTDQPKENKSHKEIGLLDSIHVIQEVKTIWASNAPSRITRKIKKDNEGNLLFASYENIIRYDGKSFTNFEKEKGIDSYDAFDVWEDKNGSIWIASTHLGVFQYPASDKLKIDEKAYKHFTTKNGLIHNRTMCIFEDSTGGIWIGTEGGISYYDGKPSANEQVSFQNFTTKDGLSDNNINAIMEDKSGKIWIGTRGNLSIYDPSAKRESGKVRLSEITNSEGKKIENVWSIIEDKKANIWLGGTNGLWRYDGNSFTNFTSISVMSVYEDKKGNLWFTHGTLGSQKAGLSRYDQKSLLSSNPKATQIFIGDSMFFGITEDKQGHIWVGKLDGVFRYDGESVNFFGEELPRSK